MPNLQVSYNLLYLVASSLSNDCDEKIGRIFFLTQSGRCQVGPRSNFYSTCLGMNLSYYNANRVEYLPLLTEPLGSDGKRSRSSLATTIKSEPVRKRPISSSDSSAVLDNKVLKINRKGSSSSRHFFSSAFNVVDFRSLGLAS